VAPRIAVTITCPDERCRASVSATIRVPAVGRARARTYTPRPGVTTIAKGSRGTVTFRLLKSVRSATRRALRAGRRVFLRVTVQVADAAGNVRRLDRRVRLRL